MLRTLLLNVELVPTTERKRAMALSRGGVSPPAKGGVARVRSRASVALVAPRGRSAMPGIGAAAESTAGDRAGAVAGEERRRGRRAAGGAGMSVDERFASVGGGTRLCYQRFGEASAPAVLLIAGLGQQLGSCRSASASCWSTRAFR